MDKTPLQTTYFVESREESARRGFKSREEFLENHVFSDDVLAELQQTKANISLATYPKEPGISNVVKELNFKNIPVNLWLNQPQQGKEDELYDCPPEKGYWHSKSNIEETIEAVYALLERIESNNLKIQRIGIDLEPPLELVAALSNGKIGKLLSGLIKLPRPAEAQERLENLINWINETHGVELYKIPLMGDSTLIRKAFGMYQVPANILKNPDNRVISMLYSSVAPFKRQEFVERFIKPGEIPALGILSDCESNPGVDFPGTPKNKFTPLLRDVDLTRDLRQVEDIYARRDKNPEAYVFALNGLEGLNKMETATQKVFEESEK